MTRLGTEHTQTMLFTLSTFLPISSSPAINSSDHTAVVAEAKPESLLPLQNAWEQDLPQFILSSYKNVICSINTRTAPT